MQLGNTFSQKHHKSFRSFYLMCVRSMQGDALQYLYESSSWSKIDTNYLGSYPFGCKMLKITPIYACAYLARKNDCVSYRKKEPI